MGFKVTLLLQQGTGPAGGGLGTSSHVGGWSESYYSFDTSLSQVLDHLYNANGLGKIGLCPARARILAKNGAIVGQRVTQVFPRVGRAISYSRNFPGDASLPTDVPQMTLLCTRGSASRVNVRHFGVKGIPDSMVTFGEYTPTAPYALNVDIFLSELSLWAFVGQDQTQAKLNIVGISNLGIMTTVLPPIWVAGDKLLLKKIKLTSSGKTVATKATVLQVGPGNTVQLGLDWLALNATGGTAQKEAPIMIPLDGVFTQDRIGVHKVGRPFGQYVGRRSKKKTA